MSQDLPLRRNLESLKKEAKRWLQAFRDGDPEARARFRRALDDAPAEPTLRDVQLALAREHGFSGWAALKDAVESAGKSDAAAKALALYETKAEALLEAYRTGTPEAMERHHRLTWHRRAWKAMRTYVQLDLVKRPTGAEDPVDITLDDARFLVAIEHGFPSWAALEAFARSGGPGRRTAARPVRLVDPGAPENARTVLSSRDWDEVVAKLAARPSLRLEAAGEMTDAVLAEIARIPDLVDLDLGGSKRLTDEGVRRLAGLRSLERLDLSGTGASDPGCEALRELPALRSISLAGTRVSDAGAAHLATCTELTRVDLSGTSTGDGALRALTGKAKLARLATGNSVTDEGLPLLHELPVFKTWHGGEAEFALLSYESAPNHLSLRGSLTDAGLRALHGLDGLFGLNIDDSRLGLTAAALEPLVALPNLGWLACDAKDDWMPHVAAMPRLRFLGAQDTTAGDDGFVALSRSRSIEQIWGRRCHNLRRRGFIALANMPALRGLSVSCLNVDDEGIAALPRFPALRELMPMDVPDAGYRHVARCDKLESLVLMYCRETTDAATEHITGLSKLTSYFNSYTTISDRTPELLSTMDSLERVTFDTCHGLTDAGVARLARLPRLREVSASGRRLTPAVARAFPPGVIVHAP